MTPAGAVGALLALGALLLGRRRADTWSETIPGITDRARVAQVQESLAALGYHPGFAAGEVNVPTLAAINQFLQDRGLPAVGGLTEETEQRIIREAFARAPTPGAVTEARSRSPVPVVEMDPLGGAIISDPRIMAQVQRDLVALGYNPGRTDGTSSLETIAAANAFLRDDRQGSPPYAGITDAIARTIRAAASSGGLVEPPRVVRSGAEASPTEDARGARIARVLTATRQRSARRRY